MILTLTGTQATVTITGLRDQQNQDLVISSANSPINLLNFYDEEDIQGVSSVIQAQIDLGTITAQTEDGDPITDVDAALQDIAQLAADIEAIEADQAAQDITIGLNQSTNTSQQTEIDQAESDIDTLELGQTTQDTNIAQNTSDISTETTNRQAADSALSGQITSNDTDISNLETENTNQQTEIDNLETEQATQNTAISNNAIGVSTNSGNIASNDTDISNLQTDNTNQQTEIDQNEADIATEQTTNVNQQTEIDQAEVDIDNLETGKADEVPSGAADGDYIRRKVGTIFTWVLNTVSEVSPWLTNLNGINYSSGNVGIDTDDPNANLQIGEQFNDTPGPARVQNIDVKLYAGTATNNGIARYHLLESVPAAFPGDYGAIQEYNGSTNLYSLITVQAGVETTAFTFERATQLASYFGSIDMNNNTILNVANPTTAQGAYTAVLRDSVKIRNAATTGNLNTGVSQLTGFNATPEIASQYGQFTVQANGITPQFTGVAMIIFNCQLEGNATRARVGMRWSTGASQGSWNRNTYIRNASGDTESSVNIVQQIPCTSGQQIFIEHDNFAGGGTVTSPANGIEFSLIRIR